MKEKYLTPIAIVIAGFIVAGAIIVGGRQGKVEKQEEGKKETAIEDVGQVAGEKITLDIVSAPGGATKGSPGAKVTIVEFSEYQCPFCKRYAKETYGKIFENYGEEIYYIFRDFPLDFHAHSQKTAEAARCAKDQGKYWEYHDILFEKKEEWEEESDITPVLVKFAEELNLDAEEFSNCLSSGKHTPTVRDNFNLGMEVARNAWDLGLIDKRQVPEREMAALGTPTFFINGRMLIGAQPFLEFQKIIEEELGK